MAVLQEEEEEEGYFLQISELLDFIGFRILNFYLTTVYFFATKTSFNQSALYP